MSKVHVIETQLQTRTWVISKKVSRCLETKTDCIWRRRNSDVTDSSNLTFRQVFTKHMVDQSITQLWKKYILYLPHLFVSFQAEVGLLLMCAMFSLFGIILFLQSHFSANHFAEINICHVYSPRCWVILWHHQILKVLLTCTYAHNAEYFAALNSDYPLLSFFHFFIWVYLLEKSPIS